jgi:hypothetical protein
MSTTETKLTAVDAKVEHAADKLQETAERAAAQGGLKAKLAPKLAEDADLLRKLKPSLIVARAKGEAPTNAKPGETVVAPSGAQLGERPKPKKSGGPNPFVVLAAALAAGIVLAKIVDWRGHAHPRY